MPTEAQEGLGRWPLRRDVTVQWGDMDAFQHVNNTVYARWFETARIAYFELVDVPQQPDTPGAKPILARVEIDYRIPTTYPDTITLECTVLKLGNSSFVMGYRATSQKLGKLVAGGEATVVMIDPATGRSTPLTPGLKQAILSTERNRAPSS